MFIPEIPVMSAISKSGMVATFADMWVEARFISLEWS
jgi:hypothetical protein